MSRIVTYVVAVLLLVTVAAVAQADNITFDYTTGIQDTMVANFWPNSNLGSQPSMYVVNNSIFQAQSLIRFENLFGSGAGQIPLGSTINNATLRLYLYGVQNPSQVVGLYNMTANWNESSTWNALGGGVRPGVNAQSSPASTVTGLSVGFLGIDVAPSLQAWANGSLPNLGWSLLPLSDKYSSALFLTSNYGQAAYRPTLSVDFTPPSAAAPEPGTLLLVGSVALLWAGRRRKLARRRG